MNKLIPLFVAVVILVASSSARSLDFGAEASLSGEYQSNETQRNDDGQSGLVYRPGLTVGVSQASGPVSALLNYTANRRIFQSSEFSDDTQLTGRGVIDWSILPDFWNLYGENQRSRSTINNRLANTPDNQQEISTTTVGTNIAVPLRKHKLVLQGEKSANSRDEVEDDSETDSYAVAYQIPISSFQQLSFVYRVTETEFDRSAATEYDSETSSIQFASTSRALEINAEIGVTSTDLEGTSSSVDGVVGQIDVLRFIGEESSVHINVSRAITDNLGQRRSFFFENPSEFNQVEEFTVGNEIFTSDQYSVSWTTVLGTNQLTVSASHLKRDYEFINRDEKRSNLGARLRRQLSSRSGVVLGLKYSKSSFEDASSDKGYVVDFNYNLNFTTKFSFDFYASYADRSSDALSREFDGWSARLTLRYVIAEREEGKFGGRLTSISTKI